MTIILVLVTFGAFIIIDWFMNHGKEPAVAMVATTVSAEEADEILSGFHVPAALRYHPGHTWLQKERKNVHRVGADEFAAILAGPVDKIDLPKPGTWVRQGQKAISIHRQGRKVDLVSPVEGEILEVNPELVKNPRLLLEDPYGRGWMMTVFAPDEQGPSRNLLPSNLLAGWMREAADKFYSLQPQLAGATMPDGGRPMKDATVGVKPEEWEKAAQDLFLN